MVLVGSGGVCGGRGSLVAPFGAKEGAVSCVFLLLPPPPANNTTHRRPRRAPPPLLFLIGLFTKYWVVGGAGKKVCAFFLCIFSV